MKTKITPGELIEIEQRLRLLREWYVLYRDYYESVHFDRVADDEMDLERLNDLLNANVSAGQGFMERAGEDIARLLWLAS